MGLLSTYSYFTHKAILREFYEDYKVRSLEVGSTKSKSVCITSVWMLCEHEVQAPSSLTHCFSPHSTHPFSAQDSIHEPVFFVQFSKPFAINTIYYMFPFEDRIINALSF